MSKPGINSITYNNYYGGDGSGTIVMRDGDGATISIDLTKEEVSQLKVLATSIFLNRRSEMAKTIATFDPTPSITYDSNKTIEGEPVSPPKSEADDGAPF